MAEACAPLTEPVTEISKTGESGEKNGYPAEEFELYRDGIHEKTLWVTDWDNIDGGREAMQAFKGLAAYVQKLQDAMPDFAKSPAVGTNAYEHLDELGHRRGGPRAAEEDDVVLAGTHGPGNHPASILGRIL